jgi:hypothetical protein
MLLKAFCIATAIIMAPALRAAAIPFEAHYTVENDYVTGGVATLSLAEDKANGYLFSFYTKPTGIFKLTRNGKIHEWSRLSSLEPPFVSSEYRYQDKGRPERSYNIRFDRGAKQFEFDRSGEVSRHSVTDGAVDRLSVTLALLEQARSNPEFEQLEILVLDGQTEERVTYSNRGRERLQTTIGEFDAIRVLKDRINSTRETIIWLAQVGEEGLVLPLQIEQYKKGKLSLRLKIDHVKLLD